MPLETVGRGSDCAPGGAEGRELGGRPDRDRLSRGMTRPGGHGGRVSGVCARSGAAGSSDDRCRPSRRSRALEGPALGAWRSPAPGTRRSDEDAVSLRGISAHALSRFVPDNASAAPGRAGPVPTRPSESRKSPRIVHAAIVSSFMSRCSRLPSESPTVSRRVRPGANGTGSEHHFLLAITVVIASKNPGCVSTTRRPTHADTCPSQRTRSRPPR